MSSSTEDEELMRELARALAQVDEVPQHRRAAAYGSYAWRTVDQELLDLTHDSLGLADAAVRGALDVRTLGFEGDGLSLEVEVDGDRVFGQVLAAGAHGPVDKVVLESVDDGPRTCRVDASGVFTVEVPTGPVRFGVPTDGGLRRTPWVVLRPAAQDG
jgi:hypothetical protein